MTEPRIQTSLKPEAPRWHGRRVAIAIGSWCLAGVGVLSAFMMAGAGIAGGSMNTRALLSVVPLVAWLSLAVMTVRWVQGRRCHWIWPVVGTVCGVVSATMFLGAFFVYLAAVPLALYLVFWHLRCSARGESVGASQKTPENRLISTVL